MVERRLVWNQVAAPDLSAASAALARANNSFTSGLEGAQGILAKYGEGQVEKADNALLSELAGIGDEAEFDAFVDGGGLEGRNISEDLRTRILDTRSGLVSDDGVRARTAGTRAGTQIRLAQEGRVAGDHAYGVRQRDELAGLSGALVGAHDEARTYGNQGAPQGTIQSQVYQGLLDRGFPEHIAQGFMMNFQDESGFDIDITEAEPNVHGTRGRGLYQLTGARRDAFEAKYGNDYSSLDNQLDFLVEELGGSESRARELIFNSQNAGEAAANIVNNFLRPASEHARERTARYVGQGGFTPSGEQTYATPQQDAFRQALAQSETLTPAQINSLLGQVNSAQGAGQGLLDDAAARATREGQALVDELGAGIINDVIANPEIQTPGQFDNAVRSHPGTQNLTESEVLDLIQRGAGVRGTEAGGNILAPEVTEDPALAANVSNTVAAADAALRSTDQNRAIGDIEAFSEDPAGALTQALNLGGDGENPGGLGGLLGAESGFDQNQLRNMINDYAREFDVEPAVVAVAMRDAFERDPTGRNTLSNRFDKDAVQAAVEQLDQDSIRNFRERRSNNQLMEIELSALRTQAQNLQTQIAKTDNPSQRQALQAQLEALSQQVAIIEERRQGN